MGCCASHTKLQIDIPFERMDEYNKVKKDIEEFLDNKDPSVRSDSNKILDLLIKASNVISKYENELRILKKNKNDSKDIGDDLIEGINQDIKILRGHHITLNNLLKESEYPQTNKKEEIFNEEINPPQMITILKMMIIIIYQVKEIMKRIIQVLYILKRL